MLPFLGKYYMFGAIIGCPMLYKLLAVPNTHAAIAKKISISELPTTSSAVGGEAGMELMMGKLNKKIWVGNKPMAVVRLAKRNHHTY